MNKNFKGFYTKNKKILVPVLIISGVILSNALFFLGVRSIMRTVFEVYLESVDFPIETESDGEKEAEIQKELTLSHYAWLDNRWEIEDLVIEFLESPEYTTKEFDLRKKGEIEPLNSDNWFDDDHCLSYAYKGGVVKEGVAKNPTNKKEVDLSSMNLYVLSYGECTSFRVGDIKILAGDNEESVFILDENFMLGLYSIDSNLWHDYVYNTTYSLTSHINPLIQALMQEPEEETIIKSDNGSLFSVSSSWSAGFLPGLDFEVLDTIGEWKIYTGKGGLWTACIPNLDGTCQALEYIFPFELDYESDSTRIDFTYKDLNGKQVKAGYYSDLYGSFNCTHNSLVISNYTESDFVPIGVLSDGSNIYIKKDESFLEQLYVQWYLGKKGYIGNGIDEDNTVPLSFEQFKDRNPVIFWETPFNRMAGFLDARFGYDAACGIDRK